MHTETKQLELFWTRQRMNSESDIAKLEVWFRDFKKKKETKHRTTESETCQPLEVGIWTPTTCKSPKARTRETSDAKSDSWNTYRISHKTQQQKYNHQQWTIVNQGRHLPRKPSRSRMRSFSRIALYSFIFHVILRVFCVLYCFGVRKYLPEWKRTTNKSLPETMGTSKTT